MRTIVCDKCNGTRLKENTKYFKIDEKDISQISQMDFDELHDWIKSLNMKLSKKKYKISLK